ncbi:hypothetical protein DSCO28_07110 [Desulfosarcina ovata subsp. sediminis]|uniref:Uncharacterized protein n=1 Tax=Desulfosarcina ovata subsp. sediminis TaxID=885957 RepID=A0A5K7ZIW7_9BACT|nr:tetratricopeptide repeat protein [Desulfosarcina ovata]BBO80145.1 hypothetical protein DSCO28_07110 [Desulfosarcina ovata subsp. sediminis]
MKLKCLLHFSVIVVMILAGPSAPAHGSEPLTIDADAQYRYARSRFDAGAHDEAIAEFGRFIHFFPFDRRVVEAQHQIGMAHFNAGRYAAAATVFQARTQDDTNSPWKHEAFFMLSRCHARQGMIEQAILDLHNLIVLSPPADVVDRAHYELGWLHVDQGRWRLAGEAFERIRPVSQDRFGVPGLASTLAESDRIAFRDPTTAGMLSIVPGGGQLYCGRAQDALIAFLLNTGLIWAAWEAFDNDQVALGGVISFVEFGFYAGNIFGAVSGAHKFNRDRAIEFRQHIYQQQRPLLSVAPTSGGARICLHVDF